MIPFNRAPYLGNEDDFVIQAMHSRKLSGNRFFTEKCERWFENHIDCQAAMMTSSCTHALEMAALLLDIRSGDEVIMPSYTFVSTANAFVLRGARIKFVDIRKDTMNIDETSIEQAITSKTKAIVVVHYAGVACAMEEIMALAEAHSLYVIEDAAQGIGAMYKGKALGTIGHIGTISFHETKNLTSGGEGGLLIVNDKKFIDRAAILREKGTNRKQFFDGKVDKYSWVDVGSSYLASELQAAYLWGQLEGIDELISSRLAVWQRYYTGLSSHNLAFKLPVVPEECIHNGHIFYLRVESKKQRNALIDCLFKNQIQSTFHYIPLHTSAAGRNFGQFYGRDRFTTVESEKLLRLPIWYGISEAEIDKVIAVIGMFFAE